jgi:hypothetical protein
MHKLIALVPFHQGVTMKKIINCFTVVLFIFSFFFYAEGAQARQATQSAKSFKKFRIGVCDHDEKSYSKDSLFVVLKSKNSINTKNQLKKSLKLKLASSDDLELNNLLDELKPNYKALSSNSKTSSPADKLYKALSKSGFARSYRMNFSELDDCESLQALVDELLQDPNVESVHLNHIFSARGIFEGTPNDTFYPNQWNLRKVNAPSAWIKRNIGSGVLVGVLDSELYSHRDLIGKAQSLEQPQASFSHGTAVSSIIVGVGDDNFGLLGVAPGAQLNFHRLGNPLGNPSSQNIINGLNRLLTQGSQVINLSFGQYGLIDNRENFKSSPLYILMSYIISVNQIPVVVAAGNNNVDVNNFACTDNNGIERRCYDLFSFIPGIISVSSTNQNDQKASDSNFGTSLTAPGESVPIACFSNNMQSGICLSSGTSFSAPLVAGAIGILKSGYGWLSPAGAKRVLEETGSSLQDARIGKLINVGAALDKLATVPFGDFGFDGLAENQILITSRPTFRWSYPSNFNFSDGFLLEIFDSRNNLVYRNENFGGLYTASNQHTTNQDFVSGSYTVKLTAISKYGYRQSITSNFKISVNPIADLQNSLTIKDGLVVFNRVGRLEKVLYSDLFDMNFSITPDGKVWSRLENGPSAQDLFVTLDPSYYQDLKKFTKINSMSSKDILNAHRINLKIGNNSLFFHSHNKFEKWYRGGVASGSNVEVWYSIDPNGNLVEDKTKNIILKLDTNLYTDVNMLLSANFTSPQLISLHNYLATSAGNTSFNWSRVNYEKWFRGRFGQPSNTNIWSFIKSDGSVFYTLSNNATTSVPVFKIDPEYFVDPAKFDLITDTPDQFFWKMNKADIKLVLYSSNHNLNWSGVHNEKWLLGAQKANERTRPSYYILPDGRLYRYCGRGKASMIVQDILVARLNTSYYQNPATLVHTSR